MKRSNAFLFAVGLALLAGPVCAYADLAVDFTNPGQEWNNGNWSLGWKFSVNAPLTVEALGFYDDQKNGLTEAHDVGIFDSTGALIVSGRVQPNDPLESWWRWTGVTPTTLVVGEEYQIAAVTGTENYTWAPAGFVTDSQVNFLFDSYWTPANGVLTYPNGSDGVTGYFGPNFSTQLVPLPGSLLLAIPAFASVFGLRRRLS